jgi:hypothetical protein
MRSRILVVGFALISAFVVAQSGNTKTEPAASNDSKQGQVKLKVTPEKVEAGSENIKKTSGVPVKSTSASPMASDDWNQQEKTATGSGSHSAATTPRDAATGMASGKRQHQPVTLKTDDQQKTPTEKK